MSSPKIDTCFDQGSGTVALQMFLQCLSVRCHWYCFFLNMELQNDCLNVTFNGEDMLDLWEILWGLLHTAFIRIIWTCLDIYSEYLVCWLSQMFLMFVLPVDSLSCYPCGHLFCLYFRRKIIGVEVVRSRYMIAEANFFSIFDRWNFDQTLWNVMQSGIAEDKTSRQNHQNCRGTSPSVYWTNHRCYWDLLTFTWSSSNSQLQIWVELEPFFTLSPSQQAALQRLVAEEPEQWRSPAWRFRYSWLWSFSGYVTWAFYSHKEYQKMKIVGHFCEILVVLPGEIP